MRDLRIQFALTFGMIGTVVPYVSVFFRKHAGLTDVQVGYGWAIWSAAAMLSPVLITRLADTHVDPRRLLALASMLSAVCLLCLGYVRGVGPVLAVWTAYCLVSMPVMALQDGIHFSVQRRHRERGLPVVPYPHVRAYGTVGYMVPSILLFVFLQAGMSLRSVLMTGAAFGTLAAIQALRIEDPRRSRDDGAIDADDGRMPTLAAARALLRPNLLVFVASIMLLQMAASVHGAYYPLYLTERVGLAEKWIGQVSNVAVFIEIFFVVGCGALTARFGVRGLLILSTAATALRFGLVAVSADPWVAVGSQAVHGLMLISTSVVPQMVLDDAAENRFRHSMQGVFAMTTAAGRVVANLLAGPVAAWSLAGLYGVLAALCVASGALLFAAFREPAGAKRPPRDEAPVQSGTPETV